MTWPRQIYVATAALGAHYTGSIPHTCGGLAQMGIQAVPLAAHVYTHKVIFE